jgi:hypothetical protein
VCIKRVVRNLLETIVWIDGLRAVARLVVHRSVPKSVWQSTGRRLQVHSVKRVTKENFHDDTTWANLCPCCALDLRFNNCEKGESRNFNFARRNKWTESRNSLIQQALRMSQFDKKRTILPTNDLEADIQRLIYVLAEVSAYDPVIFSFSLQSSLAFMTIHWPDGVFVSDFALPIRGRPLSPLDVRSWVLTARCGYTWRSAAKNLVPEDYSKTLNAAITEGVRKAADRIKAYQRSVDESILSPDKQTHILLDQIVWIEGLRVISRRVVDRKIADAMRRESVFLQIGDSDGSDEDAERG